MLRPRRSLAAAAAVAIGATLPVVLTATPAGAATTFYRPADGVLHLAGHGYGHGHGMSQWGAYGGAITGRSYRQILAWYYADPAIATRTGTLRVQLSADTRGPDGRYDAQVLPVAGLTAVDAAGHTLSAPAKNAAGAGYDRWRAVLTAKGGFLVQGHTSSGWAGVAPRGATSTSWSGWIRFTATGGLLTLVRPNGTKVRYRDAMEFDKVSGDVGVTVNRVGLDHYLDGVVPAEMPCSWTPTVSGHKRLDALDAQSVAARSYAAWRMDNPRSSHYDAVDNTGDQAYGGYDRELTARSECPWTNADGSTTSASNAAVAATTHQVMKDGNGNVIFAQFSASNGGFELSGGNAHLPSRPDAWDGVSTASWNSHSWSQDVTAAELQSAYPSIGSFTSLAVNARENLSGTDQNGAHVGEQWGGRITSLTVTGSKGSVTVGGETFRFDLGLMSSWFTVKVLRPGAPRSVSARADDASATVSWAAPATDGGGGIRSYRITASPAITPVTVGAASRSVTVTGLANDTSYVFSVAATNTAGTGTAAAAPAVTPSARAVFHHLSQTKLLDTRTSGGALGAGQTRSVSVLGHAGVPSSGVTGIVVNLAQVGATTVGSLTVAPHGGPKPPAPQLVWHAGQRANTSLWVPLPSGGAIDVTNATGSTHVLLVVEGYYSRPGSGGELAAPAAPARLFDSRVSGGPLAAQTSRTIPVAGHAGVPTNATSVLVLLTSVGSSSRNYVVAWPAGGSRPSQWSLFAPANANATVALVLPLDATGSIDVFPYAKGDVVVDVDGWFTAAGAGPTSGLTSLQAPRRLATRQLPPHGSMTVPLRGGSAAPASARSVLVTVTGSGPASGYLSAAGSGTPLSVVLLQGSTRVGTTFLAPLSSSGTVTLTNVSGATATVTVDITGATS